MRHTVYTIVILLFSLPTSAQKKWTLPECIEYAMNNNITIKQTDLQTKIAELQYKQSKLGQYPNVSFSAGPGFSSGRNQDPTSFSLITQSYLSANMQLQSSAEIFNWYSKRNTIMANQWEVEAAKAATDKLKNDIALTVANAYLQILLAKEQEKIAGVQLQQSQAQLRNTRKLVDAGSLPELNASELEAQVARDSANFITAGGVVAQNMLNLKAYMAIDAAAPFEVDTPPVELIPVEKIGDLQPDAVYAAAMANMPQQRVNDFKLKATKKTSAAARAGMYPTVSMYGSLGSGYNSRAQEIIGATPITAPFGNVTVNGVNYDVFPAVPYYSYNYDKTSFFRQLNQNFRQTIGLSMSVPIFSGGSLRTAYERSKISIKNQELQNQLDDQTLKQDIYQAYNAAMVAMEKFNASKKSLQTAERSFSFSQKRFDVG
ncbi:MAG TPA: TolC family protein, partial [Ferruginibacter sp.]|nr:TolC family protein [Ferruginibacter sp.]